MQKIHCFLSRVLYIEEPSDWGLLLDLRGEKFKANVEASQTFGEFFNRVFNTSDGE